ncbi:MAG: vegetative protein [Deltaproteobacteria bacterium]|nr:vegetative protein [Deltaproteobacteria bacterium]
MAVKKTKTTKKATAATTTRKAKVNQEKKLRCGGKTCSITGCKRRYKAKSYCASHYREWRHGKFGSRRYKTCRDKTCFLPATMNRHGFCENHFQNYYVKGIEQAKEAAPAKTDAKPAAAASA